MVLNSIKYYLFIYLYYYDSDNKSVSPIFGLFNYCQNGLLNIKFAEG